MTHDAWQIEKTHLTMAVADGGGGGGGAGRDGDGDGSAAAGGGVLAVVGYVGGDCGISLNGRPLREYRWDPSRMADCTATLLRLAGHSPPASP